MCSPCSGGAVCTRSTEVRGVRIWGMVPHGEASSKKTLRAARCESLRASSGVSTGSRQQSLLAREGDPLVTRFLCEDSPELVFQRGLMRAGHEIAHLGLAADPGAELHPELRLERRERHRPAVLRRVRLVRCNRSDERLVASRRRLATERETEPGDRKGHRGLDHRDIDDLALTGLGTLHQRTHDADHGVESAAHVRELKAWHCRRSVGRTLKAEDASAREVIQIVPGARCERTSLAIPREGTDDEPRVGLEQRLMREPETSKHPRTKLLEHDVVGTYKAKEHVRRLRLLQIDDGAPLVPVQREKDARRRSGAAFVAHMRRHGTEIIPARAVFDLVDLCAEVREDKRRERPWEEPREVEYFDSRERNQALYEKSF